MVVSVSKCVTFQNTAKKNYTSTGKCHRFIPNIPQEFDCRVKASIKPELKYIDLKIKDEEFKTEYFQQYPRKINMEHVDYKPPVYESQQCLRHVGEKLIAAPVRPMPFPLSEMKESYQSKYIQSELEEVKPPAVVAKCYVNAPGREQQPAVVVNQRGFWKWCDPYLTTNKADYTGTKEGGIDKLGEKTLTFYNEPTFDLPTASGNKTMFDRIVLKNVLPNRLQSRAQKRVPHYGMQSEYQDHFIGQEFSVCYPYLHNTCTEFEDPLPPASSWQTLIPPGMYCSEYCTIGRGSVRQIIDQTTPTKEIKRTPDCCRLRG